MAEVNVAKGPGCGRPVREMAPQDISVWQRYGRKKRMAAGTHAAQESDRFAGLRSFWRRPRYAGRDGDRRGV